MIRTLDLTPADYTGAGHSTRVVTYGERLVACQNASFSIDGEGAYALVSELDDSVRIRRLSDGFQFYLTDDRIALDEYPRYYPGAWVGTGFSPLA